MRLNWNESYKNYGDNEKWMQYYRQLCHIKKEVRAEDYNDASLNTLLDILEMLCEAMVYEEYVNDNDALKETMLATKALLDVIKPDEEKVEGGFYPRMIFLKVNAMLYKKSKRNREAATEFLTLADYIHQNFKALKNYNCLTKEQQLFLGWECIDCYGKAIIALSDVTENKRTIELCDEMMLMRDWLKPWEKNYVNVSEQLSYTLSGVAAVYYRNTLFEKGKKCYEDAIAIFDNLCERYNSDLYKAKSLWIKSLFTLNEFLYKRNTRMMKECEIECIELKNSGRDELACVIADCARGNLMTQKGVMCQQEGFVENADEFFEESVTIFNSSFQVLEDRMKALDEYNVVALNTIIGSVYNSYISVVETLAILYYQTERTHLALRYFETALELLTASDKYGIDELYVGIVRAEINQHLGMIAFEEKNIEQAVFYMIQAADASSKLGENSNNFKVVEIAVLACSFATEYYLSISQKSDALRYAEMGIENLNTLERIDPSNELLDLRKTLEHYRKKAKRRFF